MREKKIRNVFIRISAENHTKTQGLVIYTFEDIKKMLVEWSNSCKFTYWVIEHNNEENDVNKHYHIVIKFSSPTTFSVLKNKIPFGDIEKCRSVKSGVQYLVHLNDDSKRNYNWDDVFTNCQNLDFYKVRSNTSYELDLSSVLSAIESGEIKEYNLFDKVDIELYSKYKSRIINALEFARGKILMNKDRELNVMFFSGDSGTGKSTFAKDFCKKNNLSYCISSSSNDSMQDYAGEDVLIFDDLRDNVFSFTDLIKILDNNTVSSVKSRYHNKAFIGKYIIITSFVPLCDWYYNINRESKKELYRRIKEQYIFTENKVDVFSYSTDECKYKKVGDFVNPIQKFLSEKKVARDTFSMCKNMGIEFNSIYDIGNLEDFELIYEGDL